jgi:hypothetical protein
MFYIVQRLALRVLLERFNRLLGLVDLLDGVRSHQTCAFAMFRSPSQPPSPTYATPPRRGGQCSCFSEQWIRNSACQCKPGALSSRKFREADYENSLFRGWRRREDVA